MNVQKRMLCAAVAALMVVPLSACGQKPLLDPEHPTSVSIWHYYNGKQQEAFDQLVSEFNDTYGAQTGIVVTAESKGGVDDLAATVAASAEREVGSEELPNLFATYADTAYILHQKDILADLKPYLSEDEMKEYIPSFWQEGELSAGQFYVFPIAKSTELFYLNETDWAPFAEATDTDLSSLDTWEELAKVAETYYNWSGGKAFFGRDAFPNHLIVGSKQLGKELFAVDQGTMQLNLDETVMRKLWDSYALPYLQGYYGAYGRFRSDDIKTGDLIACVGSTTSSTYYPTEVTRNDGTSYAIDGKVLPVPNFDGTEPHAVQQGAGIAMVQSDERTETACTDFLKWFTDIEQNLLFCTESGYSPVKQSANTEDRLKPALEQVGIKPDTLAYNNALLSMEAVTNVTLYTSKPFEGSVAIRSQLNDLMTVHLDNLKTTLTDLDPAAISSRSDDLFAQWLQLCKTTLQP